MFQGMEIVDVSTLHLSPLSTSHRVLASPMFTLYLHVFLPSLLGRRHYKYHLSPTFDVITRTECKRLSTDDMPHVVNSKKKLKPEI